MTIDDFIKQDSEWLMGNGPSANIVMSSRARLARNIDKAPFTNRADAKQLEEIMYMVKDAALSIGSLKNALFIRLKGLTNVLEKVKYLCRQKYMAKKKGKSKGGCSC